MSSRLWVPPKVWQRGLRAMPIGKNQITLPDHKILASPHLRARQLQREVHVGAKLVISGQLGILKCGHSWRVSMRMQADTCSCARRHQTRHVPSSCCR